jgi:acyl-CoA hydrolase
MHAAGQNPSLHDEAEYPLYLATAAIDDIHLIGPLLSEQDLVMQGCVVWCSKSCMNIRIEVSLC